MTGQHRADRFGSMSLEDEQRLRSGVAPLAHPPEPLAPFPPRRGAPSVVPSLQFLGAPLPPAALELAHDERGQLERGDQAATDEGAKREPGPVWPSDPLDRWAEAQRERIRAEFNLLRRMYL